MLVVVIGTLDTGAKVAADWEAAETPGDGEYHWQLFDGGMRETISPVVNDPSSHARVTRLNSRTGDQADRTGHHFVLADWED